MTLTAGHGEELLVPERVILAPAVGIFKPAEPHSEPPHGHVVEGDVVGVVEVRGEALPVRSAFTGRFMGLLAHSGERVREGQPVAWLRVH